MVRIRAEKASMQCSANLRLRAAEAAGTVRVAGPSGGGPSLVWVLVVLELGG